jgi:hypothetical protein
MTATLTVSFDTEEGGGHTMTDSSAHEPMSEMAGSAPRHAAGRFIRRFLLAVSMIVMITVGVPAVASAAPDCDPAFFQTDNGFDVTAYELCKQPRTDVDEAVPGAPITFEAAGFDDSSQVAIYLHRINPDAVQTQGFEVPGVCVEGPDCIFVGYGYTNADGVLVYDFDLPALLATGEWEIVAVGVDPNGNLRVIKSDPISVVEAVTDEGKLPYTGSRTLRLTSIGAALFVLGGVAVASSRRLKRVTR